MSQLEIKEKLIAIGVKYIGEPMNRVTIDQINTEYQSVFDENDLSDLKWRCVINNNNSLMFEGIRPIDKLAIMGIFSK